MPRPWNKGKRNHLSAETRAKMSAAQKGKPRPDVRGWLAGRTVSAEHRAAISASLTGRAFSPEHRANLSRAGMGKGRPLSAEHRKRLSVANRELLRSGKVDPRPCEICGGHQKRGFSLDRDHDHETGRRRGLLCHKCNRHLGVFEQFIRGIGHPRFTLDESWWRSAVNYLRRHGSRWEVGR